MPPDADADSVVCWFMYIVIGDVGTVIETVGSGLTVIDGVVAEADLPSVSVTVIVKAQFEVVAVGV